MSMFWRRANFLNWPNPAALEQDPAALLTRLRQSRR